MNGSDSPTTTRGDAAATNNRSVDVAAAWAGLVGVVLFVIGSLLAGSPPKPDASSAAVASFLVQQRSSLLIGTVLLLLAIPCFGLFVGVLSGTLRDAEGGRGTLSGAATLGWTLMLTVVSVGVLSQTALVWRGANAFDPQLIRFGYDLSTLSLFAVSAMAVALAVGATSAVILRTGVLPRWLVVLGVVEVAVNCVELAGLGSRSGLDAAGYAAGIGPLIWSLWAAATAVTLARRTGHPRSEPAAESGIVTTPVAL